MTPSRYRHVRAVVLAGGRGTRLRPLTVTLPKPLVPLGDKPVLEILLRKIAAAGIVDVTICTGYLGELIMAVFGKGERFGLNISWSHEDQPLGTAGPLALIPDLTETFVVMNGDLLTTLSFSRMLDYHFARQADATIGVYPRDVKIDFGVVQTDAAGAFAGFIEKPTYHFEVSMGINILRRSALVHVPRGQHFDMPDLIRRIHETGGRVACYREDCYWLDIGRMEDYATAQEEFVQNEARFLAG